MLTHLRLQRALALGIAAFVLWVHFINVVAPFFAHGLHKASITNVFPWVAAVVGLLVWGESYSRGVSRYEEFLRNSPGKPIDTSGITFGIGHPTDPPKA